MMRISSGRWLAALFLALTASLSYGQSDTVSHNRETVAAHMVGLGYTNILDTYLSPRKYDGMELRYLTHVTRLRPQSPLVHQYMVQGSLSATEDISGDGSMLAGQADYSYGISYHWQLCDDRLQLRVGGMGNATIGFIYNTRNQNNPAQLRLFTNIGPLMGATYRFRLFNRPAAANYEAYIPLIGVMFSPNYGQSYYEIFNRGNYDHNVVFTHPFNSPSLRQTLSLDVTLGRHTWRIGYLCDIQQAKVNNLKQHIYSHALMVGYVKHFKIVDIIP